MSCRPGSDTENLPLEIQRLVLATCEHFEVAWCGGGRPALEPFLAGLTPAEREAVLRELIALEIELRTGQGERPTVGEYMERFPSDAPIVAAAFASTQDAFEARGPFEGSSPRPSTEADAVSSTCDEQSAARPETGGPPRCGSDRFESPPHRLGRYRVVRLLGRGGFGRVYLAHDDELDRDVAIKVPTARSLTLPGCLEALLDEGRLAAGLRHPSIVGVHDIGREQDGSIFIILEYVEGMTLSDLLKRGGMDPVHLAELMAQVGEAVHHAHRAGLVHRDLKPSNIIVDKRGTPRVTDFGLALTEALQLERVGEVAGTPTYMAPEQVRGEAHRLDGRTDIWALGVILYQGLTGRLPFPARNRAELFDEILHREPKPPRQIDDAVPKELERICLRSLSKRMADRYETARDLAEELRLWLADAKKSVAPLTHMPRVIPKGLRTFDERDAGFFLSLLPGPRDRDGMPESVRFWKVRIEERGAGAFNVGLLYGPSGGGKSSLVRAGLLPSLAEWVRPIFVECSPDQTEEHLATALRRAVPGIPPGRSLVEAVAALRAGELTQPGSKILVVLDQFEQWLHAHPSEDRAELVSSLRQCDGDRLQALLLVRDDFWLAIARFFRAIEVPLHEGVNSAPVELFDEEHTRRVLAEFGRAFGRLAEGPTDPGPEASRFIDEAIRMLRAADGRIIPVRLTLFTEVVRRRPWAPATIRELGGIEGIGVTFLAEAFEASSSPPSYRIHQKAAQSVLQALLPTPGSVLRGRLRTGSELRGVAGYGERLGDFAELMRILDGELRIITPVDSGVVEDTRTTPATDEGETYYQLAHESLITPVRQWIERKEGATRAGRARLRLASITASWCDRPGPQRLASPLEWLSIVWHVPRGGWSPEARRMMRAAGRHYLLRAALGAALIAALGLGLRHVRDRTEAIARLEQMWTSNLASLPELLPRLDPYRGHVIDDLIAAEESLEAPARRKLVAAVLMYRYRPTARRAAALRGRLHAADPDELAVLRVALGAHSEQSEIPALWDLALDERADPGTRLRAAAALGGLDPGSPRWAAVAPTVARVLGNEPRAAIRRWAALFEPARRHIVPALARALEDPAAKPNARVAAAEALAELIGVRHPDPGALAALMPGAPPEEFLILAGALARSPGPAPPAAVAALDACLAAPPPPSDDAARDRAALREARAAIALARLGHADCLWPRLAYGADPRLRSFLIDLMPRLEIGARPLLGRLPRAGDDERQALLLALAEIVSAPVELAVGDREAAARAGLALFREGDDPGVHGAAELLLRRLGLGREVDAFLRATPPALRPTGNRAWFVGPNWHTFAVAGPLEGWVGTPESDAEHQGNEPRHYVRTGRVLAVATCEVTVGQYREFLRENPRLRVPFEAGATGTDPDTAMGSLLWYEGARYCNWLSAKAGLPPREWCYPADIGPGMTLAPEALGRPGFRMPTEAEWELLCRAGSTTARPFGPSRDLLPRYAWTFLNSDDRPHPVGQLWPNRSGLFDVLGNQWEWCWDGPAEAGARESVPYPEGSPGRPAPDRPPSHVIRGDEPAGPSAPISVRAHRGGAYNYSPAWARSGSREVSGVTREYPHNGLRVVRTMATDYD